MAGLYGPKSGHTLMNSEEDLQSSPKHIRFAMHKPFHPEFS